MIRILLVAAATVSTLAAAQHCPPISLPGTCDPRLQGNPVDTATQRVVYRATDFTYRSGAGNLSFQRLFVSDAFAWHHWSNDVNGEPLHAIPRPFGSDSISVDGMKWSHSLYSMVVTSSPLMVRDTTGRLTQFNTCTAPCWAGPFWPSDRERLHLLPAGPQLVRPDGTTLKFEAAPVSGQVAPIRFLTAITSPSGVDLATIEYFADTEQVPNCSPADKGVPFIKSVKFAGGDDTKLAFVYSLVSNECVLTAVDRSEVGLTDRLVEYSYSSGTSRPELTAVARAGAVVESYGYGTSQDPAFDRFAFSGQQGQIQHKAVAPVHPNPLLAVVGTVTSSNGGGPARTVVNTLSVPNICVTRMGNGVYCSSTNRDTEVTLMGESGLAGTAPLSIKASYQLTEGSPTTGTFRNEPVLYSVVETPVSVPPGVTFSGGTREWTLRCANTNGSGCTRDNPGAVFGYKNEVGSHTVTPWQFVTPATGPAVKALEQTQRVSGASDREGTGALETQNYSYNYGAVSGAQRIDTVTSPSALGAGLVTTRTRYETNTDRPEAVFKTGLTRYFGGSTQSVTVATFYKTTATCVVPSPPADSLKRVLRVEGPCFVPDDGPMTTSCTGAFPVTEFEYYPTTGASQGRLKKVRRYPNNGPSGCGPALQTEYLSYSPEGLPTAVKDENDIVTNYSYAGEQLATVSVPKAGGGFFTTSLFYTGTKLVQRVEPRGNYEYFCYRSNSNDSCSSGALVNELQWKGKFDTAGAPTERVEYTYSSNDGSLMREVRKVKVGGAWETRGETTYSQQLGKARTMVQAGTATNMREWTVPDAAGNIVARSVPFAQSVAGGVPAFCASNSTLCKWLSYDRADRLTKLVTHPRSPADSSSAQSCLEYDQQGNLRRAVLGCAVGSTCQTTSVNQGLNTCAPELDYVVDDFGNTVAVTFPWTTAGARQTTEYEFDALGNVTRYRTPTMASLLLYIENSYDQLGRLTQRRSVGVTPYVLFKLAYDNPTASSVHAVNAGCPAVTGGNGRLTYREDSFGKTWYQYDTRGLLTGETRWRAGTSATCGGSPASSDQNPHTFYEYNDNGQLKLIKYPHKREVQYTYASSGAMHRPTSIELKTWNGSTWSGFNPVIENITWEPYGGLRAYKLTGAPSRWVEYVLAGNLETVPSSTCSSLTVSGTTDGSGRLRGVLVSDNAFNPGSPNGAVFKQVYTWNKDQLVDQRTCHVGQTNAVVTSYGYDLLPRLVSETDASTTTAFSWSQRDNPVSMNMAGAQSWQNCAQATDYFSAPWQKDLLFSVKWGPA